MKRRDLAAFAMIITSACLLIGACQQQPSGPASAGGQGPNQMGAQATFYNNLSPDMQKKFNDLDARHKQAVTDQVNQGMDPSQAINTQVDQMKGDKGRPPSSPGSAPMPPSKTQNVK